MKLLLRAWLLCLVAAVAGGIWRGEDLAITLLGVLALISIALVATPAALFVWTGVTRDTRRSALGSAVSNLFAGVWILSLPGRPLLATILAIGLLALGVAVIGRVLTVAATAPAPPRHQSASITGVITIFLLVIGYAKTFGGHPRWGHPSAETMTSDLRNLVAHEDQFFSIHHRYGSLTDLSGYQPTMSRATITVTTDGARFVATATSTETNVQCLVWTGTPPLPADSAHGAGDGVPACWE